MEEKELSFEELSNVIAGTEESEIAMEKNLEHKELFRTKTIEGLKEDLEYLKQIQQEQTTHERKK